MKILLGITGGIAAYKAAELLRLLKNAKFDVRVVMTNSAKEFVTPLTFQALSGHKVYTDLFESEASGMEHIDLARWADFILVAPASADFIARLSQGRADDLLTTLCLASQVPIAVAPAMNQQMWQNPATIENVERVKSRGVICFGPGVGDQACGEVGPGRLLEPFELFEKLQSQFRIESLTGKKVLITAGPTREAIDPIRYLSNNSTGKMGYTLAETMQYAGAEVTLVSGPSSLNLSKSIKKHAVRTALEMQEAVMSEIRDADIFIAAAAVADYRPDEISLQKIKKSEGDMQLRLVRNPDILANVTALESPPFVVGFAAETENLIENAKQKLKSKKLDMIIANQITDDSGFGDCKPSVTILQPNNAAMVLSASNKEALAKQLIHQIAKCFASRVAAASTEISNK